MRKRVNHYLQLNHKNEMPSNILLVDTETSFENLEDCQKQRFRLGYAIHLQNNGAWKQKEIPLWSIRDFHELLDSLSRSKTKLYIFAHNAAFDYAILKMDCYFSSRDMKISQRAIDSVFLIKAEREEFSMVFSDTMNFYRMSLDKLGRIFGERKMEKPDFNTVSDTELMVYCRQDVLVLTNLIKQHIAFLREYDLGNFKLTIASQAMTAFRHRFLKDKLFVHTFNDILEMEMASYRGGRCEAFILGKRENVYKLDVNSMYPAVMLANRFPTKPFSNYPIEGLTVSDLEHSLDNGEFFLAKVKMELKKPCIAVKMERLLFPIGTIQQTLTSPEIRYIFENPECGRILEVEKAVGYESSKIFSDYVTFFYELRKGFHDTNSAYEAMAKLFLNSLYGKFAQKSVAIPFETENLGIRMAMDECKTNVIDHLETDKETRFIRLGETLYEMRPSEDELSYDSMPIISSAVTGYARMVLYGLMEKAGLENVYYVDTDSLFVNQMGYENLERMGEIDQKELGKLKLEETGEVEIFGAKNYRFNDSVKLKGIKKDAEKIGEWEFKQNHFITKNQRYRDGTEDGTVLVKPVIKRISTEYKKGIVIDGRVLPFYFQ